MSSFHGFLCQTLDGFIAKNDGDVSYLDQFNELAANAGTDGGFKEFMGNRDTLLLGRNSFEKVISFNCPWPYEQLSAYVWSSSPISVPDHLGSNLRIKRVSGSLSEVVDQIRQENASASVYVDGARVIQSFIDADLLDSLSLTMVPVLLGSGIRLLASVTGKRRHPIFEQVELRGDTQMLKVEIIWSRPKI